MAGIPIPVLACKLYSNDGVRYWKADTPDDLSEDQHGVAIG